MKRLKTMLPFFPVPILGAGCLDLFGVNITSDQHWKGVSYYSYRLPYVYSYGGYYYAYRQFFLEFDTSSELALLNVVSFYADSYSGYSYAMGYSFLFPFEKEGASYQIELFGGEEVIDCSMEGSRFYCPLTGELYFERADYPFNYDALVKKLMSKHN